MKQSKTFTERRLAARTIDTTPTMTDQSQAAETDIQTIIGRMHINGTLDAARVGFTPQYADFTQLPTDLRGFIEMGRSLDGLLNKLPPQFKNLTADKLFSLTNEQITNMLTPEPPPAPKVLETAEDKAIKKEVTK